MKARGFAICFFYDLVRVYRLESATTTSLLFEQYVDVSDPFSLRQTSQAIANQLLLLGYSGQPVMVGLDAFQVLTVSIPTDDDQNPAARRKFKLEVLLEEFCPIDTS